MRKNALISCILTHLRVQLHGPSSANRWFESLQQEFALDEAESNEVRAILQGDSLADSLHSLVAQLDERALRKECLPAAERHLAATPSEVTGVGRSDIGQETRVERVYLEAQLKQAQQILRRLSQAITSDSTSQQGVPGLEVHHLAAAAVSNALQAAASPAPLPSAVPTLARGPITIVATGPNGADSLCSLLQGDGLTCVSVASERDLASSARTADLVLLIGGNAAGVEATRRHVEQLAGLNVPVALVIAEFENLHHPARMERFCHAPGRWLQEVVPYYARQLGELCTHHGISPVGMWPVHLSAAAAAGDLQHAANAAVLRRESCYPVLADALRNISARPALWRSKVRLTEVRAALGTVARRLRTAIAEADAALGAVTSRSQQLARQIERLYERHLYAFNTELTLLLNQERITAEDYASTNTDNLAEADRIWLNDRKPRIATAASTLTMQALTAFQDSVHHWVNTEEELRWEPAMDLTAPGTVIAGETSRAMIGLTVLKGLIDVTVALGKQALEGMVLVGQLMNLALASAKAADDRRKQNAALIRTNIQSLLKTLEEEIKAQAHAQLKGAKETMEPVLLGELDRLVAAAQPALNAARHAADALEDCMQSIDLVLVRRALRHSCRGQARPRVYHVERTPGGPLVIHTDTAIASKELDKLAKLMNESISIRREGGAS